MNQTMKKHEIGAIALVLLILVVASLFASLLRAFGLL